MTTMLLRAGAPPLTPPRRLPGPTATSESPRSVPEGTPNPRDAPADTPGDRQPPTPRRHAGLDALRGLAALVVVLHHTLLVAPWGQASEYPGFLDPLMHTPLQILVDGPAAVWMFFVLSGIVVMLPVARWTRDDWMTYLPKRLVRLYLPAAASVPLALGVWWFAFRSGAVGESDWAAGHHDIDVMRSLTKSLTLLTGTTILNSPLWSLRWELIFSLVFPALAVAVVGLRRLWPALVVGCLAMSWWGMAHPCTTVWVGAARYLPLFVIGMVIADRLPTWRPHLARVPRTGWWVLTGIALTATTAPAMEGHVIPRLSNSGGVGVIGASLLVFVVAAAPVPRHLVSRPTLTWLASRSFALYLVHEPIVLACSNLVNSANPLVVGAVALPVSFASAEAFARLVERPSQRLARRIGRSVRPG